jgi:release factor glutamine methyltransferase
MNMKIKTIKDIRFYLAKELKKTFNDPEILALSNIIIKTVTGNKKLHILAMPERKISQIDVRKIINICNELKTGKPIQYIMGETDFYNCKIKLSEDTLIPRPETEELVDLIIKENRGFRGNILDIGTGSGCIAIALAVNLPGSSVTGIDISVGAIKVAEENSMINNISIKFIPADIFSFDQNIVGKTEIIVSNPPYVRDSEKQFMNRNILDFEPHKALFVPDADPLMFYRSILSLARKILIPGGKIYFEINEAFGTAMLELLEWYKYSDTSIINDINGKARLIRGIRDGGKSSI